MQFNRSGPRRTKYAPPEKTRIKTAPKAKAPIDIEIEDFINIPGIGDMSMPKPKPKTKVKPKPKAKAKAKSKVDTTSTDAQQKKLDRLNKIIKNYSRRYAVSMNPRIKKQNKRNLQKARNQLKELKGTIKREADKKAGKAPKPKSPIPIKNPGGTGPVYRDSKGKPKKAPRTLAEKKLPKPAPKPAPKPKAKVKAKPRPPAMPPMMGTGDYGASIPTPTPAPPPKPKPKPPVDGLLGRLAKIKGDESNLSELDKLKSKFEMLTNQRFIRDPGPEHHQAIKDLGDQIYALDKNFESPYYTRTAPTAPTPTRPDLPEGVAPGGFYFDDPVTGDPMYAPPMPKYGEGMSGAQVMPMPINLNTGKPNPPSFPVEESVKEESIEIGPPPGAITPQPAPPPITPGPSIPDSGPPVEVQPIPEPTPPPSAPPAPPPLVKVDPFKGFSPSYRPENIVGQSFDPSVREDYEKQMQEARARMMQPGGNIAQNPTYQTPTMAVPQTQFGGYGQPMPIAPLLPYSGLAAPRQPFVPFSPESKD
jgi:hypothetical protein